MTPKQLFSFMVSAFCFLCMITNGFIMNTSGMKIVIQMLLLVVTLMNLYLALKGFVVQDEATKDRKVS